MPPADSKLGWEGEILSVQPRIRLTRSWDEFWHTYQGYVLRIRGAVDGQAKEFSVAVGKAAHEKHQFRIGDRVKGKAEPVADDRTETAELYKVSGLKILKRGPEDAPDVPPFQGVPPALEVYREKRHRRLATRTYNEECRSCIWGCRMAVEILIDKWKPWIKRYRKETFCYGPIGCQLYRPGPKRKVPGKLGESLVEEDWVDRDMTAHREVDE